MNHKSLFCTILIAISIVGAVYIFCCGDSPTNFLLMAVLFSNFKIDYDQDGV